MNGPLNSWVVQRSLVHCPHIDQILPINKSSRRLVPLTYTHTRIHTHTTPHTYTHGYALPRSLPPLSTERVKDPVL